MIHYQIPFILESPARIYNRLHNGSGPTFLIVGHGFQGGGGGGELLPLTV